MHTGTRLSAADWPDAIADSDGPQLVVAGPGAGKTEFLVRRAAHLLRGGSAPTAVRVLSFSRRGAGDLTVRIRRALGGDRAPTPASTFHSLAARIIETHGPAVLGWDDPPALLTGPEQVSLVAELLAVEDPAAWPPAFADLLASRSFAEEVTDFVLRATEHGLTPADVAATGRADWVGLDGFMDRYRNALVDRHRLDYAALIATATDVAAHPVTKGALADEISHLLVDEYQDTTPAQAAFLEALLPTGGNLTVAADPYQSIYSFRGASLQNVASFPERFTHDDGSPARRWILGESFRVPEGILRPAERLTRGALPGAAGPVTAAGPGGRVDVWVFDQQTHEADWVAGEVERLHLVEGIPYASMAVLVRSTRRFLPDLSRSLDRRGISHDRPDARLVDHPAVRAIADVATLAGAIPASEVDQRRAARRLFLGPVLGLGIGEEREALRRRLRSGAPWSEVVDALADPPRGLADLLADPGWATSRPAHHGFWHLWTHVDRFAATARTDPSWRAACTSFAQVVERLAAREPETPLAPYLALTEDEDFEASPLLRHDVPGDDRLVVTTLHQAKGLEFDVVFIADAVDGVLPDLRRRASILDTHLLPEARRDPVEAARFRVQEEMRLAYTAMTRARERVVWTATAAGVDESEDRPSRFLDALGDAPLGPPGAPDGPPVTPLEAEAMLRRTLTDPAASPARRLAALATLTDPTLPHLRPADRFPGVRARGPATGLVPEDAAFSPSQATAYAACPRRYSLERHLGIGDEPNVYMHFGLLIHGIAERLDRRALEADAPPPSSADAHRLLADTFDAADFGGPPWSDHWYRRAEKALTNLYDHPPHPGRPAFVERPLEIRLDGERWRGRADRIDVSDDGVRIVDYKTGKGMAQVGETRESLQLGFYSLAAAADPEVSAHGEVTSAELWYPLAKDGGVGVRSFDLGRLEVVAQRLTATAAAIRDEVFPPTVSNDCRRCAVRILCDAWPDGAEAFVP